MVESESNDRSGARKPLAVGPRRIHITVHALDRFSERGAGPMSRADARRALAALIERGQPIAPTARLLRRLRRHPREAVFLQAGRWILVIADGCLVTVEHVGMPAWRPRHEPDGPRPLPPHRPKGRRRRPERATIRRAEDRAVAARADWEVAV